ncbi:STAS/SEC14 domain-containing protein [Sulfurimonas sp. NWX79]|uniref:STAS/SEC14 domain-containing protein n=1 Tax=Sulfurimonas sp. NWX79 TaxID=2925412 RepID=UPI003204EAD7
MVKVLSDDTRKDFLGFELSGIVTAEDYEKTLISAVQEKLKSTDKLRVLYHVKEDFDSYELKAMFDDAKAGVEFWNNWEKIAVVSDVSWIINAVKIFAFMLPGEIKTFSNAELEEAKEWLFS